MNDGSPINSSIFTIDVSTSTKTLVIYSNDSNEVQTYALKASVTYTNYGSVSADTSFDVIIEDDCNSHAIIAGSLENKPLFLW